MTSSESRRIRALRGPAGMSGHESLQLRSAVAHHSAPEIGRRAASGAEALPAVDRRAPRRSPPAPRRNSGSRDMTSSGSTPRRSGLRACTRSKFSSRLPGRAEHQRRRDAVDPDALRGERPRGQFGEAGQRLLRQGVAEEIGIGRGELRIQQLTIRPSPSADACAANSSVSRTARAGSPPYAHRALGVERAEARRERSGRHC